MESYDCPAEDLPFTYPNWQKDWYSPVCRPWYKDQKNKPSHAVMTDIYEFPSGKEQYGLSNCQPIVNSSDG